VDPPFVRGLTLTGRAIHTGRFFADQANTILMPELDTLRYWHPPIPSRAVARTSRWWCVFQVDNELNTATGGCEHQPILYVACREPICCRNLHFLAMAEPARQTSSLTTVNATGAWRWWHVLLRLFVVIVGGYAAASALVAGAARALPITASRAAKRCSCLDVRLRGLSGASGLGLFTPAGWCISCLDWR